MHRLQQFATEFGQLVFDARRKFGNCSRRMKPSRSRQRSVVVSIFCEMPPTALRSSLKRMRALAEPLHHQDGPFVADSLKDGADRAAILAVVKGVLVSRKCLLAGSSDSFIYGVGIHKYQQSMRSCHVPSQIAVVIGSTRVGRFAVKACQWIAKLGNLAVMSRSKSSDLKDYPMPFFAEARSPLWAPSEDPVARKWQAKLAEFDGFIFTAAEYNHAPTAVLKNALDYARCRMQRKTGRLCRLWSVGGARAVEQLRMIAVNRRWRR